MSSPSTLSGVRRHRSHSMTRGGPAIARDVPAKYPELVGPAATRVGMVTSGSGSACPRPMPVASPPTQARDLGGLHGQETGGTHFMDAQTVKRLASDPGRAPRRHHRAVDGQRPGDPARPPRQVRAQPPDRGALRRRVLGARAGGTDIDAPQAADLLSILTELSRNRARQGFSATETAVSVFALKDALYESLPSRSAQSLADYAGFSLFVDRLGLYTVRELRQRPRRHHQRAVRATARALHPGGEALGRRGRRAADRHAGLGPLPDRDGAAAAGPGGHRLAVRDPRHHRRARPSTPRSPSTSSRRWWRPS